MDRMDRITARRALAVAAAAAAVAGLAVSAILAPGTGRESGTGLPAASQVAAAVPPSAPAPVATTVPAGPPPTLIATLHHAEPYSSVPGGPPVGSLQALNPFGNSTVVAVVGNPTASGWLHVELPVRPNGSLGWLRASLVRLTYTNFHVLVSVEQRKVTVTDGTRVVLATAAAVGKPSTPTPTGHTYLWELIRPTNPYGAYGPFIFGLAWFSDAYSVFNGGDAQIGMHGQDEPWSIGLAVSHGCIRLPNSVITRLAGLLPLGTPVTIN
jgi:lipoprotein-anchoring transpeptidase ErfK/SrfK